MVFQLSHARDRPPKRTLIDVRIQSIHEATTRMQGIGVLRRRPVRGCAAFDALHAPVGCPVARSLPRCPAPCGWQWQKMGCVPGGGLVHGIGATA